MSKTGFVRPPSMSSTTSDGSWRYDYNAVWPNSSLGNLTPLEARRRLEQFEGLGLRARRNQPVAMTKPENSSIRR